MADYTYNFSSFPNNTVDSIKLGDEVVANPSISINLSHINVKYGDNVKLYFDSALSAEELTVLNGVIAVHDGIPYSSGGEFWAESLSENGTTSTNYLEKLSLQINVSEGNYKINWYFEAIGEDENAKYYYRVQIDDTNSIMECRMAFKKSYSDSAWRPTSGFGIVQLSGGIHKIDIDYKNLDGSKTTYIRNARIHCQEVS